MLLKKVTGETNKEHNKYNYLITKTRFLIVSPFLNLSLDCKCILKLNEQTTLIPQCMKCISENMYFKYIIELCEQYRITCTEDTAVWHGPTRTNINK